eukprot:GHVN01065984.1.p1 GENE.GHVN01065984.1~~GHVN01065984.1.p1  ORF type:complete len:1113 (-),score=160.57 GHVN01065984.1:4873-8124(-)
MDDMDESNFYKNPSSIHPNLLPVTVEQTPPPVHEMVTRSASFLFEEANRMASVSSLPSALVNTASRQPGCTKSSTKSVCVVSPPSSPHIRACRRTVSQLGELSPRYIPSESPRQLHSVVRNTLDGVHFKSLTSHDFDKRSLISKNSKLSECDSDDSCDELFSNLNIQGWLNKMNTLITTRTGLMGTSDTLSSFVGSEPRMVKGWTVAVGNHDADEPPRTYPNKHGSQSIVLSDSEEEGSNPSLMSARTAGGSFGTGLAATMMALESHIRTLIHPCGEEGDDDEGIENASNCSCPPDCEALQQAMEVGDGTEEGFGCTRSRVRVRALERKVALLRKQLAVCSSHSHIFESPVLRCNLSSAQKQANAIFMPQLSSQGSRQLLHHTSSRSRNGFGKQPSLSKLLSNTSVTGTKLACLPECDGSHGSPHSPPVKFGRAMSTPVKGKYGPCPHRIASKKYKHKKLAGSIVMASPFSALPKRLPDGNMMRSDQQREIESLPLKDDDSDTDLARLRKLRLDMVARLCGVEKKQEDLTQQLTEQKISVNQLSSFQLFQRRPLLLPRRRRKYRHLHSDHCSPHHGDSRYGSQHSFGSDKEKDQIPRRRRHRYRSRQRSSGQVKSSPRHIGGVSDGEVVLRSAIRPPHDSSPSMAASTSSRSPPIIPTPPPTDATFKLALVKGVVVPGYPEIATHELKAPSVQKLFGSLTKPTRLFHLESHRRRAPLISTGMLKSGEGSSSLVGVSALNVCLSPDMKSLIITRCNDGNSEISDIHQPPDKEIMQKEKSIGAMKMDPNLKSVTLPLEMISGIECGSASHCFHLVTAPSPRKGPIPAKLLDSRLSSRCLTINTHLDDVTLERIDLFGPKKSDTSKWVATLSAMLSCRLYAPAASSREFHLGNYAITVISDEGASVNRTPSLPRVVKKRRHLTSNVPQRLTATTVEFKGSTVFGLSPATMGLAEATTHPHSPQASIPPNEIIALEPITTPFTSSTPSTCLSTNNTCPMQSEACTADSTSDRVNESPPEQPSPTHTAVSYPSPSLGHIAHKEWSLDRTTLHDASWGGRTASDIPWINGKEKPVEESDDSDILQQTSF